MRRRPRQMRPPSLFPFLSVLFCLLGCLMFIGVAMIPTALESATTRSVLEVDVSQSPGRSSLERKRPLFLECTGEVARTLDGRQIFRLAEEERGVNRDVETPFERLLDRLAEERREYLVFVVRPDGLPIFQILRGLVEEHNRTEATASVSISESSEVPASDMPPSLARRARYADGRLSYQGVMSPEHHDALRSHFSRSASRQQVDALFELSQRVGRKEVAHGVELLPESWQIRTGQEAPSAVNAVGQEGSAKP